jgi:transposase-like protein
MKITKRVGERFVQKKICPELVNSWEGDLDILTTYLRYPYEKRGIINTTNILKKFIKEVKRRTKVIEVSPNDNSVEKIIYLVSVNMNEIYRERKVKNFELAMDELRTIKRARYEGKQENNYNFKCEILIQVIP